MRTIIELSISTDGRLTRSAESLIKVDGSGHGVNCLEVGICFEIEFWLQKIDGIDSALSIFNQTDEMNC